MITPEKKAEIIKEYQTKEGDTGSPEVQVAILTYRINDLNEHLKLMKQYLHELEIFGAPLSKEFADGAI